MAHGLRERDPQALAAVYDRYGRIAFALIYRAVRDSAVAEDLVQDTFLRVWNRAASFDPGRGTLGAWITTVARNRAIDYLRSTDARMAAGATDLEDLEAPTDTALAVDRSLHLEAALRKLTPGQREVIRLAYYEGLSQSEMASRLKQPLGTVKTWVRTALSVLRAELA